MKRMHIERTIIDITKSMDGYQLLLCDANTPIRSRIFSMRTPPATQEKQIMILMENFRSERNAYMTHIRRAGKMIPYCNLTVQKGKCSSTTRNRS
ncbi:hypothetical protein [Mesobacillus boroniphilus]|uniref:hypothetical protein n=1 Tax=Mesobacillus boroniphilus TaxID=308892 RepID=UPI001BCFD47A|nr:hypothetical protein [Mesobacillus boroniphilus]